MFLPYNNETVVCRVPPEIHITAAQHAVHQGHCERAKAQAEHPRSHCMCKCCQLKDFYFLNGLFRVMSVKENFISRNQGAVLCCHDLQLTFRQASKMQNNFTSYLFFILDLVRNQCGFFSATTN